MKIGISTACFYPLETEKALAWCAEAGVRDAEVFFNAESELTNPIITQMEKTAKDYGIKIYAVHPFTSFMEPYLLFSRYERRFKDGIAFYKRYFEAAYRLGASILTIHGGRPDAHITDEIYCERFSVLRSEGKKFGITVAQENVNAYKSQSPDFIRKMRGLMKDDIDFVFDVKQSVRAGYPPEQMLEAMGERIVHLHLSDYNSRKDCILPGKGEFDFSLLFKRLDLYGYKGAGMIELYNDAFENGNELMEAKKYLEKPQARF